MFCQSARFVKEHQSNVRDMVDQKIRELSEEDIRKIADTYQNWRQGKEYADIQGFFKAASSTEIGEQDYTLTPGDM